MFARKLGRGGVIETQDLSPTIAGLSPPRPHKPTCFCSGAKTPSSGAIQLEFGDKARSEVSLCAF